MIRVLVISFLLPVPLLAQWNYCSGTSGPACISANVGIGTTATPYFTLDVSGGTRVTGNTYPSSGSGLELQYDSGSAYIQGYSRTTGSFLPLYLRGSKVVFDVGNVGIGTTSPAYALDVAGASRVASPYAQSYPLEVTNTANKADSNNYVGLQLQTADTTNPLTGSLVLFTNPSASGRYMRIGAYDNGVGWDNLAMYGNVGIGTSTPQHALQVSGTIGAEEVIVSSTGADYVFDDGYKLAPLSDVAGYIAANHHLPDMPSAEEMKEKGAGVSEMQSKLLAKIEELTLHMIQAEERNTQLEGRLRELQEEIAGLRATQQRDSEAQ